MSTVALNEPKQDLTRALGYRYSYLSMKKVASVVSSLTYLVLAAKSAFADIAIGIEAPTQGYSDLGKFITNIIGLAFGVAIIIVLIMLVWGSFDWILSGGDKDAVGKARGKIVNALIGLAVLSVAFALADFGAKFLGFSGITGITVPSNR